MTLNFCQFIGHCGKDPTVESLSTGARVAKFSIAVTEKWRTKDGEKKERTEWVSIVVWSDGLIGIIEKYVHKGSKLYVSGKMQTRKWEKDGVDRYTTEIILDGFGGKIELLDSKPVEQEQSSSYTTRSDDLDSEIPF